MALTTTISSSATQDDSQATAIGGANGKTSAINTSTTITMAEGTGAGQADLTLQKTITLNAGNSYEDNINIFDGTEEDEFGVVFNIKEVKAIYFEVISDPVVALANCEVFADQAAPSNEFKGPLNDVTGVPNNRSGSGYERCKLAIRWLDGRRNAQIFGIRKC